MTLAAQLIKQARGSAGLTMAELARRAGTSTPTVSRYESGQVDPRVQTLERLLQACGQRLHSEPTGLPTTTAEIARRFEGSGEPTTDDVTRTVDGRELRTVADLHAFAAELLGEGLLST